MKGCEQRWQFIIVVYKYFLNNKEGRDKDERLQDEDDTIESIDGWFSLLL